MFALLENLFNYNFMPHGYCYAWTQKLIGLNVLSGFFTALAYFSVSAAIIYFAQGRNDLPAKTKHIDVKIIKAATPPGFPTGGSTI